MCLGILRVIWKRNCGNCGSQVIQLDCSPSTRTQKHRFPKKPKGQQQIQDHVWKALSKENLDLLGLFLSDRFLTFYKIPEGLDSSCRILLCRDSGVFEVPRFVSTARLDMDCRVGLRWHVRCGRPISKPRPVLGFL